LRNFGCVWGGKAEADKSLELKEPQREEQTAFENFGCVWGGEAEANSH